MTDTTNTSTELVVHPMTGEALDLKATATTGLAGVVAGTADLIGELGRFRQTVIDELAHRLDTANARSERVGGWVLETNPPTTEEYLLDVLEDGLNELVTAGELDEVVVKRVITWTKPAAPSKRVDKREVNKLKSSENRKVLAVLAKARRRKPNTRTLKLTPCDASEEAKDA